MLPPQFFFPVFFSLAASLLICANAEFVGRFLKIIDQPDNDRKRHGKPIPLVGGIAIMMPVAVWSVFAYVASVGDTNVGDNRNLWLLTSLCGAGVTLVGFLDDRSHLSPGIRTFFLLAFLSLGLAVYPGLYPASLTWGSFQPTPIHFAWFAILAAISSVGIVNAVNMADGQNGLVSGLMVIWSACLVIASSDPLIALISGMLAAATGVVFLYNLRGKLFLGDAGSYGGTFTMGLLAMVLHARGDLTLESIIVWFFLPVADCIRLIIFRVLSGRSPFLADRKHFHHRLQDKYGNNLALIMYVGAVAGSSIIVTLQSHLALVAIVGLAGFFFSYVSLSDPSDGTEPAENYDNELENDDLQMSEKKQNL